MGRNRKRSRGSTSDEKIEAEEFYPLHAETERAAAPLPEKADTYGKTLRIINELGKRDNMGVLLSILSLFQNEFNP